MRRQGPKAFDSSFVLVRLFTEDLDGRRLARNEGTQDSESEKGKGEYIELREETGGRERDRNRKVRRMREAKGFEGRNKLRW